MEFYNDYLDEFDEDAFLVRIEKSLSWINDCIAILNKESIEETILEQSIDYMYDFTYPVIIYKADRKIAREEYVGYVKNQDNDIIPVFRKPPKSGP